MFLKKATQDCSTFLFTLIANNTACYACKIQLAHLVLTIKLATHAKYSLRTDGLANERADKVIAWIGYHNFFGTGFCLRAHLEWKGLMKLNLLFGTTPEEKSGHFLISTSFVKMFIT